MRPHRNVAEFKWRYLPKNVRVYVGRDQFVVLWVSRLGAVYGGLHRWFLAGEAQGQKAEVMAAVWEGPMKRKSLDQLRGVRLHADPAGLVEVYPALAEFLTVALFENGDKVERRESPTVTIWAAGGQWKMSVKDRAEGLVLWLSASTWTELLQMAELFVLEPDAPWRHDEGERQGKRLKN